MGCNKEIALNFVIAHSREARPFIDYFRLRKNTLHKGFNVFENDRVCVIVSGQGNLNAASATAYLAGIRAASASSAIWVNAGVAGHRDHGVGSLWRVNKVADELSGRCFYPAALRPRCQGRVEISGCGLKSVVSPVSDYPGNCLYDMEAAGFFHAATRFATLESIVSFKVVSDNRANSHAALDQSAMADLLVPHVGLVADYLTALKSLININKSFQDIEIRHIKFTYAQKEIVADLIRSLHVHGLDCEREIDRSKNAGQLITLLIEKLKGVELLV